MSWPVLPQGFLGGRGTTAAYSDNDTYQIGKSLRFNSADSAYLNRTFATAGNRKTWTWSGWVKRSGFGTLQYLFSSNAGTAPFTTLGFYGHTTDSTKEMLALDLESGATALGIATNQVFKDPSAWYHIVAVVDTTQVVQTNRLKLYVNGAEVTSFQRTQYPATQNSDYHVNAAVSHVIGCGATANNFFNGYLAEVNFIDGQALTPSSFGETDAITGRWKAKAFSGNYGTNGFYLPFLDNSGVTATTIGKDNSTYRMLTAQLNGTSNGIEKGGDLTGIANGKSGTISMWCNFPGASSGNQVLWNTRQNSSIGTTLYTSRGSDGKIGTWALNSAGAYIMVASTTNNIVASAGLYHIYISWDLAVNNRIKIYVNGVDQALTISTFTNDTIQYSVPNHGFGGHLYSPFTPTTPVMVGQLYVNYSTYLDPVANISKFYNAGKPVSLGTSGEIPTGSSPIVYLDGDATSILTNRGTGGNFVAYGTLATGTTYEGVGSHYNNWTTNNLSVTPGSGNDSLTDSPSNYGAISTTLVDDTYQISKSLRFNSADSAYLNRTLTTPTNNKKWSYSFWVKRTTLKTDGTSDHYVLSTSSDFIDITQGNGQVRFFHSGNTYLYTPFYRDYSSWGHYVFVYDSDNATQGDRFIVYFNGSRVSGVTPSIGITSSAPTTLNTAIQHNIGLMVGGSRYFDGYLAEVNFIDGQALTPTSFGTRDINTYLWKPKAYTGTYGTNGFYLNFSDSSSTQSLGWDQKGNITRYIAPGTYSYTVPTYSSSLVVEVWGGGGGGGQALLPGTDATNGGQSSFNGTVIANGGNRGVGASSGVGANGTGGTASGGDTNTTGNTGNSTAGVSSSTPSPNSGNSAIAGVVGPGGYNGVTGFPVGSGGGGAYWTGGSVPTAGAGGSGGYSKKTYAPGAISGTITVVVGAGGAAGVGNALPGGAGTDGMVRITVDGATTPSDWYQRNLSVTEGSGNDSLVDSPTYYGTLSTTLTDDTYQISRSLRFNSTDLSYLSRTPSVAGNRKTWTWSGWVKRAKVTTGTFYQLFGGGTGTGGNDGIFFDTTAGGIYYTHAAVTDSVVTTSVYRDPSVWYHIVFAVDTNQVTASDRIRIYVNGSEVKNFATANYPTQYADNAYINTTSQHRIGAHTNSGYYFDGYLAEVNFVDGQALTPDSFGVRDTKTYAWKAKAYAGTYGTNGFYLPFSDNTALTTTSNAGIGKDFSGNSNYWATSGLAITEGTGNDSLVDSPTYYGTLSITPSEDTYQISRSLRFKGTNTSLSRTPTVAGNRRTWTWSAWVKRSKLGISGDATTVQQLFNRNDAGGVSNYTYIYFLDDNSIQFLDSSTGSAAATSYLTTKTKFTDTSNWYHIVLAVDTTQATETNRVKLYVNGTLMTSFTSVSWPGINNQTQIGTLNVHHMGSNRQGSQFFGGYFAEVNFVDGQALAPESFGVRESGTFLWKPKAYTGAYGTNGFYLPFTENTSLTSSVTGNIGLGKDFSGNTNFWSTDGGISVSTGTTSIVNNDSFIDVPTYYGTDNGAGGEARGSYATMDPAYPGSVLSNGNLRSTASFANSTFAMTSGKYYFEATPTTSTVIDNNSYYVGVTGGSSFCVYALSGNRFNGTSWVAFGNAFVTGDVIGVAVDISAGTVNFYKNNVLQGTQTMTVNQTVSAFSSISASNTGSTFDFNFGQRAFKYAAPTGFKALRDYNKPPVQTGGALSGDYCTLNPLSVTSGTFTNGNLRYAGPGSWKRTNSTMSMSTGKWYYEVTLANAPYPGRTASTVYNAFGFSLSSISDSAIGPGSTTDALVLLDSGYYKNFTGATTDGGTAFLAGDVLSVAVDLDANTFVFSRNNIQITSGTIGGTPGRTLTPCILSYSDQYGAMDVNFGQRPWAFGAPLGFRPLRDYNKPNIQTGGELSGGYATLNPLSHYLTTFTNGNLDFSASGVYGQSMANFEVSSGKWYFELTVGTPGFLAGIIQKGQTIPVQWGVVKGWYSANGNFYDGATNTGSPAVTYTTGDVIGFALDLSEGTLKGYKNGTLIGTIATGLTGTWYPAFSGHDGGPGARTGSWNFGQRQYVYPPPFGFKPFRDYNKLPTPTGGVVKGNYATLNPLFGNIGGIITDGNLTLIHTGGANNKNALGVSSIAMSTGKWYCEFTNTAATASDRIGIISSANTSIVTSGNPYFSQYSDGYSAYVGGGTFKENNNTASAITNFGGSSPVVNDVYMVAVDLDSNKVWFGRNGSWANNGNPATGAAETYSILSGRSYYFACNVYLGDQLVANFGQRPWAYDAPFGFKPLCTTSLTQPIVQKSSSYMDVVTYTGNGSASQDITSLSFSPDLVWLKSRTDAYDHRLKDSIRGNSVLFSNLTNAESAYSLDFLSNGIRPTLGFNDNISSKQYVAWAWDKSPIAGMDIVSYSGTGSATTVAHSLGVAPKMMIVKSRNRAGDNWDVYHASVGATGRLYLNLINATDPSIAPWNNTAPTSSVFTVGTAGDTNATGVTYIAYCFAEVEGFSKFGSYTGNGLVDGPFVYCGFRPRYVMVKRTDVADAWIVKDTARSSYNGYDVELYPNYPTTGVSGVEGGPYSPPIMDYLSNGFKLRSNTSGSNATSGNYIFAAFAESPFKYSRAR